MAKIFDFEKMFKQPKQPKRRKEHTHSIIKQLEKEMKKQFFWKAKPDRKKAMGIIITVLKIRGGNKK